MSPAQVALAEAMTALLLELVAKAASLPVGAAYTRDRLPPGFRSAEAWAARCRGLFGRASAYRSPRGWVVPVDAWHAALAQAQTARPKAKASRPMPDDLHGAAAAALAASTLKLVKGAR